MLYFLLILCPFQKFYQTCSVDKWAVVNFSARCDVRNLIRDLMRNASAKGIVCFSFSHIFYCSSFLLLTFSSGSKWRNHLMCLKRVPL